MAAITHILFPFDFSRQGEQTVPFVKALACRVNARVTLYSVMPPAFDAAPAGLGSRMGDDPVAWKRELQDRLDHVLVDELAGVSVERVADCGNPALRAVRFAESHGVDLIMMPTHGLGLFRSLLVGSVTSKVLHDAKCPVWTAPHTETQRAGGLPKTVLCAIDGSTGHPGAPPLGGDIQCGLRRGPQTPSCGPADYRSAGPRERTRAPGSVPAAGTPARRIDPARCRRRRSLLVAVGAIVPTVAEAARRRRPT